MQPIVMLAIVGVAAIALGTGFLNNDIKLWIQDFGVGAGNIELELDHAVIDFNIVQLPDDSTGFYKNRIDKCIVTPEDAIGTTNPVAGPALIDPKAAGDVILVVHANTYSMGT